MNLKKSSFSAKTGRNPSIEELAKNLDLTQEQVKLALSNSNEAVSLDSPIGEDKDTLLLDSIEDKNGLAEFDKVISRMSINHIFEQCKNLSFREKYVIEKRFGLYDGTQYTLEEIAQEVNLTRERVRQIEEKGLRKLRLTVKKLMKD